MTLKKSVFGVFAFLFMVIAMPAKGSQLKWFKGNTHSHTKISGHADSSPSEVAGWYLKQGYNFLVLSEHNHFIDPASVALPKNRRADFILIPGVEVTGAKKIHSTALNVKKVIPWQFDHEEKWKIVAEQLRLIEKEGGSMILNHPNWLWALTAEDLLPVAKLSLFELYNGSPDVHNHGDLLRDSTEALWDKLLTNGQRIYGVASDDAHQFKTRNAETSNPGTGWVMVRATSLTADAIVLAMKLGQFYSSSGIVLSEIEFKDGKLCISVDQAATNDMLKNDYVTGHLQEDGHDHLAQHYPEGLTVEFITEGGKVISSTAESFSCLEISKARSYLRAKVTWVRASPKLKKLEEFYAWTQPIFL